MRRRGVVVDLARRREQRELDAVLRVIRRAMDAPDYLVEDVLGTDPRWDRDDYDDVRTADRMSRATGLRWPAPGLVERTLRMIRGGR